MQKEQLEGFRLSPQQKHLWTLQQGKSLSPYRVQYAVQITGNLNLEVLETVLQSIVNQHEILRTNFNCLPGMSLPLQVIAETYDISLDKFDLVGVSHEEQQDKIAALFTELKAKAFSLENSPPLYAYLVTLSSTKYILMLSLSALIADSFTIDKLFNKIDSFYTAYLKNKTILDEPMQYADIAEWQNEILSSEDSELGKEYWQKQGGILTDNLKLWSEKKPSIASEFQPQYVCFEINNSFIKNIAPLAEQYEVDKSDFFLACWLILLGKITRQSDIVLGVIGDGRQYEELESALGPLAKHLPLACHVEAEFKYSEIVQQIHQSLNEAYEWQEYFTYQDSESACPFSFEFAEYPEQPFAENLLLSWYQQYSCIDRFKIKLSCINTEDSLITQIYFDSRLYERQDVEILAEQFQSLLASALENPETAIGQLNILSDRDKQKLLVEFNNTQTQYPQDKTIHQLFEEQVNRAPNEIAVVFEEQQLTYSELNTRANQLANYLQSQGVKPDALVGIYLERSLEMIIALLGVLKSGGAYIPLDPTLPQEGLVSRVEDAQVPVILTQESLVSKLAEIKTAAITVDTNWEVIAQQSKSDNLVNRVTSQNLAYVLFTSGSTGKPKGVAVEHRQLTNYINAIEDRLNLAVCDNLALVSTFAADLGNTVIFPALCNGGCLHVISSEAATNPEILANYFQDHSIDCLKIVPSHLSVLLKSPQAKNILPKKRLILGGEACSWKLIAQIQQLAPECLVFNHYGPTETTVGVLTYPIKLEQASDYSGTVPLGHPLANTQIYILDDLLQPVPIGVPGELFIGGHGVAREYLNRPSLTNEKFISSPFGATDQNHGDHRIYKTGDLARYLPDGNIEFLGRIDNQVKIRGFRIELGEIETTISQHPAVLETVVVAREESPNLKRLVAYIVAQPESALTISALREFLEAKLPGYMVPSAWVTLKALPLTPNGKVNRKALPTPEPSRPELEAQFVAPQTVVQKQLAEIWTEVLGVENIGINDNFFELGGDSILSLQVIYQANQKGLYLKPKQLFQHQTIARLAEVAGTTQKIQAEQGLVTGELELMPIQHYFLEQQQPEPQYYNQAILLEIKQEINPVDLEKIIDSLQKHHDLLRLRFIREEASTQALISAPTAEIPLTCYDFSLLPPAQQTSAIEETANKLQASLNLTQGPLFQVALFDLGQERGQRLLWIIHHLAVDGVSWRILIEDFQTAYQQISQEKAIKLPSKTTSYQQWSSHLQEYANSLELVSESDFWLGIQNKSISSLPRDFAEGSNTEESAATVSVSLSREETQSLLQQVPIAYRTQINDVLLTALVITFNQWTGDNSLLINLDGHGREELFEDVDLSRTVGWFTTIFPVHLELNPENAENLGAALKSLKEQLRKIPNRGVGYGLLRYLSENKEIAEQLSSLKSEVIFNYLGQFDQVLPESALFSFADESSGSERSLRTKRNYLIEINSRIYQENLEISWSYSKNLYQPTTIEALAQNYIDNLRSLIGHCQSPDVGGFTPSDVADFPQSQWKQSDLDAITSAISIKNKNIEDVYPLSPMQQGLLFHSLADSESKFYFGQSGWKIKGKFDIEAFRRAWQKVVELHSILRTGFVWEGLKEPVQFVQRQLNLPWQEYSYQDLSSAEQQQKLESFLQSDRALGFELTQAPLMRLTLIQLGEDVYNFTWSCHHLLLDGWSGAAILKEVLDYYKAFSNEQEILLESVRPYRDYIVWLQQQNLAQAETFWRQTLAGFTTPTSLSLSKGTSLIPQADDYHEQEIELSFETTAALQAVARQQQLTLNSFLQGAWALLMSRYSGQEDIVFGAVTSGRPTTLARAESMVGLFINTVPIRIQVSPEESLLPLLYKIQEFVVEVGQYEYCPLIKIQGWSEIAKGFPLFESLVVFENYVVDESLKQNNINLEIEGSHGFERTNYPITLIVVPDQKISLRILVNDTSRFDHNTLTQMLGHLKNLLEGMVANQQQRIGDLLMLSEAEQQKLLVEWNDTAVPYSQEKCIHQLFEAQVAKTPDAVAVVFEKQTLTYTELNTKANQLAHYLQQLGVNPEILVGICVERSFEMVIGLLAILKAGGAYVPLDPNYPLERLSYMLEDSQPRVLLTQEHLLERLPNHQAQVICLDNDWEKISTNSTVNPESNITIDNLAYVIYTSGSTGKPKGAMNNHSGILNRLLWMQDTYQLTSVDAVLQKTPFSFDVSVWEFFWTLMSGARLVVARPNGHKDPDYLVKLISQQQITTLHFVPSMLQVFLEARDVEQCQSIRQVIASGEALPAQLQHRFWQRLDSRLDNLYGPTEAAVDVTYWQCQKDNQKQKTVPIGRPIANIQVYLLDDDLNPVPVGVTGELYLGGVGVGRGYFNRPDLTAEKFIPHPFSNHTVDRLYKTGDLAHYLPNGDIEYIGRIDNQVKVRGFRIELGEIEAMITQHPAVRETVVIAREESDNAKRLVAYVVSRQESTLTISALREFLESKLPDYMVPSAWVTLETLPLTPNGKVDRKALPEPSNLHNLSNDYIPPRNDTEATIINIWQQLLETQKIGIKDNFFEIGGHSLIATRVISQIRQIFQVELPLRSIFEHPTVTGLAQEIEQGIKSDSGISLTPIKKVSRSEKLPLSFAQQRLWVLSQLEPDSPAYNIPAAFRLQGKLDVSALVKTFSTIIQRHEILRTTVTQVEDELVQIIHPQVDFQPVVIDIANLHQNLQDQEIKELVEKEAAQPFDLAKDLLLRVTLIKLTDIEHIVLFTMHHVISDGWSMGILVNEFSAIYKAFVEGEPSPLPKLTLQYLDYAVWQREWLQGDVLDKQLSYWKQQLGNNLSVLELAIANPQPEGRTFRGGQQKIRIDKDLSQNLQNLSTENGVTLFMTLLAAFKTLLHWYSNQEDIVVGTDIANRHQGEIENLIGFFVNQLVLRTDLSGNPTFKELLAKVRQVTLDAYANQDLPFNKLVEVLNPKRNLNYTPLFQVKMILQNTPIPALELPDLQLTSIEVDKKKTVENDLLLAIEDTGAGLNCLLKYDVDLFSSNNMAELLENLELILSEIARQPELRLNKIKSILAKAEENRQQTREHDYQNTLMQKLKKVRRRSLN